MSQDEHGQHGLRQVDRGRDEGGVVDSVPAILGEAQPFLSQPYRLQIPLVMPRAVWVLLAVNVIIFTFPKVLQVLGVQFDGLPIDIFVLLQGAKDNQAIQNGAYYRLLTAMFLHAGWLHIGFNVYALYAIGPEAERLYGRWRFLAVYFIAGLAGSVASYAFNSADGVGASGAIFGLIGGLAAFYYVSRGLLGEIARRQIGSLVSVIMINLFIGFSSPLIDNAAHIGGLIGGVLVGWLLAPRFEVDERLYPPLVVRRGLSVGWPAALGVLGLLVALVLVIHPA